MGDPSVNLDEPAVTAATGVVKIMGMATIFAFGPIYTGITAVVGGVDGNTVAIGTTLGVSVTFAALILRMVVKNQGAIWEIVRSKDKELLRKDVVIARLTLKEEYTAWEREQARFRANERTDPGPFQASPELTSLLGNPTTNSDGS